MSDEKTMFTADEFADYWESFSEDEDLGINFMAGQVVDDSGRDLLSTTATTLAHRHGVSSNQVKSFRAALRKACKQAGIEDVFSPKKTKTDDGYVMVLTPSKPHASPRVKNGSELAAQRMRKWVEKGECTLDDLRDAVTILAASAVGV